MFNLKRVLCAAALVLSAGAVANADVITDWNDVLIDTIRAKGGGPIPISRYVAITNVAMFEAVNSCGRKYEPYIAFIDAPENTSKRAAAAAAAHRVLTTLFPDRQAIFDAALADSLAEVRNDAAEVNGIALGQAAADAILAERADDGSDDTTPYVLEPGPGHWKPTPPQFVQQPHAPNAGRITPWAMIDPTQFRPITPLRFRNMDALLRSKKYADQVNEVKSVGARNSKTRTAEQTEIAWFWANDRDGTFKPPGQQLELAKIVSNKFNLTVDENSRLFALLSIAMADAGICAWDCKYDSNMDLWRPVTAIREADTDNNPLTTRQGNWIPLLDFSPPFPAYTSGHATFGAASAAILADFVGTDNVTFTLGTDEPIVRDVTRTFHSFSEAARENGLSRTYLGVHYRMDADQGFASGSAVGHWVFATKLRVRNCPADFNKDGRVNSEDMFLFTDAYFAGERSADLNRDGVVNSRDMTKFSNDYADGCSVH